MISRSKFNIDENGVRSLFNAAGIGDVTGIAPLGAGEFNAVFCASAGGREYAVKIAPPDSATVMTYEKDMMASEVFWYRQMQAHTDVCVPEIYFEDFSKQVIPTPYFIMEKLPGQQLDQIKLSAAEKAASTAAVVQMAAQMHQIKNDKFGYIQNGLHDSWFLAMESMVCNVLADCAAKGKKSPRGDKLLQYVRHNRAVLEQADCCMVNFDIWAPNILCTRETDGVHYAWIDHERSFWGDRMVDFVCFEMFKPLADKADSLAAYNAVVAKPVLATKDEQIRYAVALGYLGLIMEVERYYRYTPHHFGWWRNTAASGMLFKQAFGVLENG